MRARSWSAMRRRRPRQPRAETRSLGLVTCTALVIGNMVGSGFFIAPSALAPYGTTALIGWAVMAVGAICLGMVFARLARIAPATGGPYAYTRMGFGPFAGFLIAWGYWISIWASLPAMAAALVGYLGSLVPALAGHRTLNIAIGLAAIWGVAFVNLRGVKEAGLFQSVTTYTKVVPFVAIAAFGLFWVDWQTFETLNPSGQPFLSALAATAPLTMFAFLGIESATVPAGDVIDPERTIPRATLIGTVVSALIYLFGTAVVMGVIPRETLMHSSAPFADAAGAMWGGWAATVIALAAVISSLGALNGWTLMLAQVPMAAARDGAMPAVFGQLSPQGVPARGILISVGLSTMLMLLATLGGLGAGRLLRSDRQPVDRRRDDPLRLLLRGRGDPVRHAAEGRARVAHRSRSRQSRSSRSSFRWARSTAPARRQGCGR